MGDFPDQLDPARNRDLAGRAREVWARRVVVALAVVPVALALAGVLGQRQSSSAQTGPDGTVKLVAPPTLRGGLLWSARIDVRAVRDIAHPRLVLAPGYAEGMQVNSIEPAAEGEAGRSDGSVVLSYPQLTAGDRLVVYLQFQVNPTTIGKQDASVELDDAERALARVGRTITVLP